jgi:nicotinamidase-related amidase
MKMKEIDVKDSALVLIEYQNEWLDENSKLYKLMKDKKQFLDSINNSKKVLEYARKIGMKVIHVPFIVSNDYKEFGNNAKYGLRAVIPNVKTWQGKNKDFHSDFIPKEDEFIVSGRIGASAFSSSNLDAILRNNDIKTLFFIGYATNVCVESSFREAHDKGYNSIVIDDATSSFTQEEKEYFLKYIVHHFGATISTKEFLTLKE